MQSPHLAITKAATETNYDSVGDVIHYTIVATNDGNMTLRDVTVTDPNVGNLSCTPANGSSIWPRRVDQLHGVPHGHPGRPRCRPLPQHRLCR